MSEQTMFLVLIATLIVGAVLVIIGEGFLFYANRSNLYSQERYDAAFRKIIKREMRLEKQRARMERRKETADGIQ